MTDPFAIPEWVRRLTPHVRDVLPATFGLVDGIAERHGSWQWTATYQPDDQPARWLVLAITLPEGNPHMSVAAWQLTPDASEIVASSLASELADPDSGELREAVASVVRQALAVDAVPSLTPTWAHLVVFLMDGSASMTAPARNDGPSKAQEAARALARVVERVRASPHASNLWLADITFNDRVRAVRPPRRFLDVPADESFDPTAHGIGGTDLRLGLHAARDAVAEFFDHRRSGPSASALVLLLTDGHDDQPRRVTAAARSLMALPNTSVAACRFGASSETNGGSELLSSIVSSPHFFTTVRDAEQLRRFYESSVMATSGAARDRVSEPGPPEQSAVMAAPVLREAELRNWERARDIAQWDEPTALAVLEAGVREAQAVRARAALGHAARFSLASPQAWLTLHARIWGEHKRS